MSKSPFCNLVVALRSSEQSTFFSSNQEDYSSEIVKICQDALGLLCSANHKRDLKPANLAKVDDNNFNKKTALVKHVITKDHRVDWDHSKILTFEIDFTKRRFLESFCIHNSENSINDKENYFYSEIYDNLT